LERLGIIVNPEARKKAKTTFRKGKRKVGA
jgi:hypothetical protein